MDIVDFQLRVDKRRNVHLKERCYLSHCVPSRVQQVWMYDLLKSYNSGISLRCNAQLRGQVRKLELTRVKKNER